MALCAGGSAPDITAFLSPVSVVPVSGQGGVPPCPGTTRLSRGRRGCCGVHPLRPPASLLHNAALPSVPASRCAKAALGAGHRCAPCRVKATGVMQSGLRWSRSHSRQRFPVACTPYAPPPARPCGCRGSLALVRRCAQCVWSVTCGQPSGVCPRPPSCLAAARRQPCALVCPSAPQGGSLSPRASAPRISRINARANSPTSCGTAATCGAASARMICPWRGLSTCP